MGGLELVPPPHANARLMWVWEETETFTAPNGKGVGHKIKTFASPALKEVDDNAD